MGLHLNGGETTLASLLQQNASGTPSAETFCQLTVVGQIPNLTLMAWLNQTQSISSVWPIDLRMPLPWAVVGLYLLRDTY